MIEVIANILGAILILVPWLIGGKQIIEWIEIWKEQNFYAAWSAVKAYFGE